MLQDKLLTILGSFSKESYSPKSFVYESRVYSINYTQGQYSLSIYEKGKPMKVVYGDKEEIDHYIRRNIK